MLIFAGIGIGAAGRLGIYGWPALSLADRILIFPVLVALAVLAAFAAARQMRPGSRSIGHSVGHDISGDGDRIFLDPSRLQFGKLRPIRVSLPELGFLDRNSHRWLMWLLVRRRYILAPISAGCLVGLLAGLTGLFTLELHCPILAISHVAVWHTAVLAVTSAFGAACGWMGSRTRSR